MKILTKIVAILLLGLVLGMTVAYLNGCVTPFKLRFQPATIEIEAPAKDAD